MAAEIEIIKVCGEAGYETETVVAEVGLKSVDDATTPVADAPITIPAAGTNYSYESWLRFRLKVAPSNKCDNFKIWSNGSPIATGVVATINTSAVTTYSTPVNTQSTQGTRDNFANHDSSNKISVGGTLINVGDKTDFMVFQLEVSSSASPGDISFTCYYSYDEQ